ncbi:MAG TPA: hypothetical protein VK145_03255 [Candidatus Nanoarchaeia archaeon]|nr:hypothetical protein [Candidatus Nanoarchaeia archaeon]
MNLQKYSKIIITLALLVSVCVPNLAGAVYKIENIDVANALYKDFVVGPGKVELEINPGESKTTAITVSNRTGGTRTFSLEVEDFTGSKNPNEAVVLLGDDRGPYSLRDFLKFESSTFELRNGERAIIPVTVSLPTDVDPGGHYGSVLVRTTQKEATGPQSSAIVSRLGVLFFVKVPGDVEEEGQLTGFNTLNGQKIFGKGPITLRLLYENNGSVYVNPYGEIRIKNMIGQEVGMVEVDPWFSLPQSIRMREITWNRPFLFGRYTATASINRGYDNIVDTLDVSFWVIPWKIALGILACLFVLIMALRFIITRFEIKRK